MPLYVYVCRSCNEEQEHLQRFDAPPPPCEKCGAEEVEVDGEKVAALEKQLTCAQARYRGSAGWGGISEIAPGWGARKIEGG